MEIRVLKYFLAIARERSILKAAEKLYITQPTLSRQIMELEEELGTKLIIRGNKNRKIILTEDGMRLRKKAAEIIELSDRIESEFKNKSEDIIGDIYIGSGESDSTRIISKVAIELKKNYPNICYHLYSGNSDDIFDKLDNGLLDFGILIGPANIENYNYLKLPFVDTWGLLMRKDSILSSKVSIELKDMWDIPLIISKQSLVENQLSGWGIKEFEKLNIVATYNLIFNASIMVDEGFGYALCLDKLVNTAGNSNLCFVPLEPPLKLDLNIVWKKYQVFSKGAEKFLEALQKELSNINNK